jgi:hypothetical protein
MEILAPGQSCQTMNQPRQSQAITSLAKREPTNQKHSQNIYPANDQPRKLPETNGKCGILR